MPGQTYYVDPAAGNDANDGLSPSRPIKTYASRKFLSGDRVLFKRGSTIRDALHIQNDGMRLPITYGAYGEGSKPAFLGSVPAGDPGQWVEDRSAIWRHTGTFASEVCNLIFNHGESCGNLRWQVEDLRHPGEWHYTGIGASSARESHFAGGGCGNTLYLYSPANPGLAYASIECALWGERKLAGGQCHVILENLSFRNAGVHGYHAVGVQDAVIRNCEFRFIGGAVWNRERRIRFGNAIELWDGARDVTVEGCLFHNIYDSGVTHQGGETRNLPERVFFRNNLFIGCGLAAYECREPSQEVYFENNTCIDSGGGFSLQGEPPPRQSEIHPQPIGHHVFVWRIAPGTQTGPVYIHRNLFCDAPYGAAIYSIIDPADEHKLILDHNGYSQTSGEMLVHMGGRSYPPPEFARYQKECGQDRHSRITEPIFADAAHGDYRQSATSPCLGLGTQIDVGWISGKCKERRLERAKGIEPS